MKSKDFLIARALLQVYKLNKTKALRTAVTNCLTLRDSCDIIHNCGIEPTQALETKPTDFSDVMFDLLDMYAAYGM